MASSMIRAATLAVFVGMAHAQGAGGAAQQQPSTSPAQPAIAGHVPYTQITPANVAELASAWTFRTGDLQRRSAETMRRTKFQVTPLLAGDRLLVCTPFNEVIALDPGSGRQSWRFDPKIADDYRPANLFNCRGVTVWRDPAAPAAAACRDRVLTATNDGRLIALDLADGMPCAGFGESGQVKLDPGMPLLWPGEFQVTSAPVVVGDTVIVGSAMADNQRVEAPHGTVQGFDARTGARRRGWDPVPRDAADPATATWGDGWRTAGHANVWAPMSVDPARGRVFLPTSSPSPDFYGGLRPGGNLHANSVVALDAGSGRPLWHFQTIHHDVWDYDVASAPAPATVSVDGRPRDVVVQGTKTGMVFVLDRDTGEPGLPVRERPVPQGGVPGEALSPTQPFPADLPLLGPERLAADDIYGFTPWDRGACRRLFESARYDGMFTPPSKQGSIIHPFTGGGVNWGGLAIDPASDVVYVNSNRLVHRVTLFAAERFDEIRQAHPKAEVSRQRGAPFGMMRQVVLSPMGLPCNRPPWSVLSALDLRGRRILWEVPLGTTEEVAPLGLALRTGTATFGGPLHTASGLLFIGATMDRYLRAFDAASGRELWFGRLPAAPMSTPASYEFGGRQYVVIAAGGHGEAGSPPADAIVAFALPRAGEPAPGAWQRWLDRPGRRFMLGAGVAAAGLAVLVAVCVVWWRRRW